MRLRIARKIYFPSDVGNVYRETTIDRARHRLRLGNPSKWRRLRDDPRFAVWACAAARKTMARVEYEP
jgi:hypothetical protein